MSGGEYRATSFIEKPRHGSSRCSLKFSRPVVIGCSSSLAQLVERLSLVQNVAGSTPVRIPERGPAPTVLREAKTNDWVVPCLDVIMVLSREHVERPTTSPKIIAGANGCARES